MRHTVKFKYCESDDDFALAHTRGWMSGIVVTLDNGVVFEIEAYDPERLKQDAITEFESGTPGMTYHHTILVPSVDREHIELAIKYLLDQGELPVPPPY